MLSPQTIKPKAVMQARNKLQQKAMEPSAEASKLLEPHAVSSATDMVQPSTMSWFMSSSGFCLVMNVQVHSK